jgi:hypothetical protein
MTAPLRVRLSREGDPTGGPIRLDEAEDLKQGLQLPRQTLGHVLERAWADGVTVSYGAQVRAYGRYEVTFGTNKQGWNRTRAELEIERIVQQIERAAWVPPRLEPREDRLEQKMAELGVQYDETFRVFAKSWWRSKQLGVEPATVNDYEWRLGYLQRFFGRHRLNEITPRLVDRFRDELAEQAETIRAAQARADRKNVRPLMEKVTDKRGRTYERKRRPLSNTSINAMITLLGQVMQQALDYELIDRNPVRVGGRSARFLKRSRPNRTFLEVDEYLALLDAAGELEVEASRLQGARAARDDGHARACRPADQRDVGPPRRTGGSTPRSVQARRRQDRRRGARSRDLPLPAGRAARARDGPPVPKACDGDV